MIYLRTGKPGASKTLNSVIELTKIDDFDRPKFYNNVKLFMLDLDVVQSFSGWFYGWYFPRLQNKPAIKKLQKIMKRVHNEDEFIQLSDVPWLQTYYEAHDHILTFLHWCRKSYSKKLLFRLEEFIQCSKGSDAYNFENIKRYNLHFVHFDNPNDWHKLPNTSIIFIDECQQFFPPRGVGARVPEHISKFETHRHKGFDVHLITQDPKLIDVNIRRLVGKHIHFHNAFGGKRVTRYETSKCIDPDNYFDLKSCSNSFPKRDSNFYGIYWSAEIHTHKGKTPKIIYVGIFCILFMLAMGVFFYQTLFSKDEKQHSVDAAPVPASSSLAVNNLQTQNPLLELTKDVYVTGYWKRAVFGDFSKTDYVFEHPEKGVFNAEELGFRVEPISPCSAKLVFGDIDIIVTCNPFTPKPKFVDYDNEELELASN
ncbi:zonular occludens toxin [Photobacterium leiognathi lrivu.4.1]|uniref:Zonular occludens toxin n=1 Tax=Photobacterium leiognathi lrivu.4.1 TaxID=1248232 RepID=V5ENF7_PHOLE|nr:zonular occludens toxin domain-containing protein [Photobacterium leiognathi]GAD29670.1 zonular occludens toxin [Photobacterium leiognathi lrivu.4.1]